MIITKETERQDEKVTNVEEIPVHEIAELSRDKLITCLLHFPGRFKFDFTLEYLQSVATDQLRHMLLAAYIHAHKDDRKTA
ncbi:MAG: hypothetical protein WC975_15960 [Phycisphaerae bacterium]